MATTSLSKCTSTELETLLKIAKATFVETFGHLNDPAHFDAYVAKAFTLEQFEKELSTPGSDFYLLTVDGHAAGYLKLNFPPAQSDLNEPQSMEIERIYFYKMLHRKKKLKKKVHQLKQSQDKYADDFLDSFLERRTLDFYHKKGVDPCQFSEILSDPWKMIEDDDGA